MYSGSGFGDFPLSPKDGFICFFSSLLQRLAELNDSIPRLERQRISIFDGVTRPAISIQSYMERIVTYSECSPACYVVAFIYLCRFSQHQPWYPINSFNVHGFIITSVMAAAKFIDDIHYDNASYAIIGDISSTREMNLLEKDFLFGLHFDLNVTPTTFYDFVSLIRRNMLFESPPLYPPIETAMQSLGLECKFSEDKSAVPNQKLNI